MEGAVYMFVIVGMIIGVFVDNPVTHTLASERVCESDRIINKN
jgi:hypothetical protein